jgi:prepilin-type N-terminal cleavage/methylation domain-containing protein
MMQHFSMHTTSCRRFGFTLLEVLGVLAVLTILAAVAVPAVIKRIDRAASMKETATLSAFSDSLTQYVVKSNTIPDPAQWAASVASQLNMAPGDISATPRRYNRGFLIDPTAWFYGQTPYSFNQSPYGLTYAPTNSRIIIVASLGGLLPTSVTNFTYSAAVFNDLWGTPQGAKPTNAVWSTYKGTGDDLLIQRVNLESLFHRVVLWNNDLGSLAPNYSVNGNGVATPNPVPAAPGWSCYYLDGTILGLRTNGSLQVQEVIRQDMSRVFENGFWRDELGTGAHGTNDFATSAALFFTASAPPNMKWGQNPKGVYDLFSAFMSSYGAWASAQPCFNGATGKPGNDSKLVQYMVINDLASLFTSWNGANSGALLLQP